MREFCRRRNERGGTRRATETIYREPIDRPPTDRSGPRSPRRCNEVARTMNIGNNYAASVTIVVVVVK